MSKENDVTINLGVAVLIALAVVCAIGLSSLLIIKWGDTQSKTTATMVTERETKLADMKKGMAKERASYRVISKEKGTVQLPLDVAMAVTLKDLQNQTPRPSGVPVNPAPAQAPDPASAAEAETQGAAATEGDAGAESVEKASAQEEASE